MMSSLQYNHLKVVLMPAPEQRHQGHMIRVAVGHNAAWYKDFVAARGKHTDRQRVMAALRRVIDGKAPKGVYDFEIFEAVKDYMINFIEDPDAVNYFVHGVPF